MIKLATTFLKLNPEQGLTLSNFMKAQRGDEATEENMKLAEVGSSGLKKQTISINQSARMK